MVIFLHHCLHYCLQQQEPSAFTIFLQMIHFRPPKLSLFWFGISAWDWFWRVSQRSRLNNRVKLNPELSSGNPATSWFHYIGLIYRTKQVRAFFKSTMILFQKRFMNKTQIITTWFLGWERVLIMRRFFIGENEISFVTTYAACYIFEVIHLVDDIRK